MFLKYLLWIYGILSCRICCGSSWTVPLHCHVYGGVLHHYNDCSFCLCHLYQRGFTCWRRLLYPWRDKSSCFVWFLSYCFLLFFLVLSFSETFFHFDSQTWSVEPWALSLEAALELCFSLPACVHVLFTFWVWLRPSWLLLEYQRVKSSTMSDIFAWVL